MTTYREAVRESIRAAMLADDRVFLMGEDVGRYGGCYAVAFAESGTWEPVETLTRHVYSEPPLAAKAAL